MKLMNENVIFVTSYFPVNNSAGDIREAVWEDINHF